MYHHNHPCDPSLCQPPCPPPPSDNCPPPTPIPPPIPPVRYIPGMNVQEQLCHMASVVNESINRWNAIQGECYKALDNMVGAAVNNDVYYSPDEVKLYSGYSSEDSCPYQIIEARCVDRSGKPIFMHLKPAYNNVTNTGAKQPMEDASFIMSANAIMTAYNPADIKWHGPALFKGDPGEAGEVIDGEYGCGWNRNGVLRIFPTNTNLSVLKQNRMVNFIGPVIPIIEEGELTYQALNYTAVRGSIQALGWKKCNGNKVMFSCTNEDQPGMSVLSVAKTLQKMGVTTAVITCYQATYGQVSTVPPIKPEEPVEGEPSSQGLTPEQQGALGLTGGMMYIGGVTGSPLDWQLPQNGAFWVITKKPDRGQWPNQFTTEVADICQNLGFAQNELSSIQGKLDLQVADILLLKQKVEQNTADIQENEQAIVALESRMSDAETRLETAEQNITTLQNDLSDETQARIAGDAKLQQDIDTEREERIAGDNELTTALQAETAARTAEDTAINTRIDGLQKSLQEEQQTRNDADQNLMNAINNEVLARQTADTALDTKIESVKAALEKNTTELQENINAEEEARVKADEMLQENINAEVEARQADVAELEKKIADASLAIGPATTEKLGLVKIGENLTITEDGTLSANASGGSGAPNIAEGAGIKITTEGDTSTIAVDPDTVSGQLPVASTEQKGIMQVGRNLVVDNGTVSVPIGNATTAGVFRVGNNLSVDENGVMSVVDASGQPITSGEVVEAGQGINVIHDKQAKSATVSVQHDTTLEVDATENQLKVADTLVGKINDSATRLETAEQNIADNTQKIADLDDKVDMVTDAQNTAIHNLNIIVNGDTTADPPTSGLTDKVTELEKVIKGDPTTEPATPGLEQKVENIETSLGGTEGKPGIDARLTELENTVIKDVVGDNNITVTIGEDRAANVALATTPTVDGVGLLQSGDQATLTFGDNPGGGRAGLKLEDAQGDLLPVIVPEQPSGNTDAISASYLQSTKEELEQSIADAQNEATAASSAAQAATTKAENAKTQAAQALTKANEALLTTGGEMSGAITLSTTADGIVTRYSSAATRTGRITVDAASPQSCAVFGIHNNIPFMGFGRTTNYPTTNSIVVRGVGTPLADTDAANKKYVDGIGSLSVEPTETRAIIFQQTISISQFFANDGNTVNVIITVYSEGNSMIKNRIYPVVITFRPNGVSALPAYSSRSALISYNSGASTDLTKWFVCIGSQYAQASSDFGYAVRYVVRNAGSYGLELGYENLAGFSVNNKPGDGIVRTSFLYAGN